jgi:hypothetical protein
LSQSEMSYAVKCHAIRNVRVKISVGRNVQGVKYPQGKMSVGRNVYGDILAMTRKVVKK